MRLSEAAFKEWVARGGSRRVPRYAAAEEKYFTAVLWEGSDENPGPWSSESGFPSYEAAEAWIGEHWGDSPDIYGSEIYVDWEENGEWFHDWA